MENDVERDSDETKKIIVNEKQYYNIEEVPEPFRAAIQARLDAARAAGGDKQAETRYKMVMQKDFKFQGGPGLSAFLKFLIKLAPPPPQKPREPKPTGFAVSEEKSGAPAGLPQPGAIKPSSSGMLLWVIVIGIAAFYWFYSSVK